MTPGRVWRTGWVVLAAGLVVTVFESAPAQTTGSVTGRVVDAGTGQSLAGAQVTVSGTQLGGLANENGVFMILNVPAGTYTLRAQMIGYASQDVQVTVVAGKAVTANFSLAASAIRLDEIVVTGTGGQGQARRTLGNSISSVEAAEIAEVAPVTNVRQLIQGRTPGVMLVNTTGVVGGGARMRIRGSGSLNAGNEPVVYVDGIRVQSGQATTEGNTAQAVNLLEAFNPNDIESIEVIKGPAAATLYGAEAASGVIQIITKKGRPAEGLQWTANFKYGRIDWAPGNQIATYWLCTDERIDDPVGNPGCQVFTKDMPLEQRLLVDYPLDPTRRSAGVKYQYEKKGWTEDYPCLFPQQAPCNPTPLRTGLTRTSNLSVRGGGESYNFYISGEKTDQSGTFQNNYNNRIGGRANFGFVPSTKANFNVNVGYAQLHQQIPQSDNSSNSVLRNAYRGQAGGPPGQYLPGFRNYHPEFSNKYQRFVDQERLTLGVTGNYNPFRWWRNRLTIGLDRRESENNNGNPIDQTGGILYSGNNAGGSVSIGTTKVWLWTVDYAGSLVYDINQDVQTQLQAGMQMTRRRMDFYSVSGTGFVANSMNLVSAAAIRNAGQEYSEQTSLGFYVQEQVGWKNRLFATAALRFDDNSAFGREFEMVVYPKASLSWVISDEEFFDVDWIDELKLRGAWGRAGNAPAPFSADRTYEAGRAVIGDVPINTLRTDDFGNPNLKAETGDEIELGFEGSLFGGRLGVDFTAYNKTTRDALVSVNDPPSSGWTGNHLINVGEINNRGLELALTTRPIDRDNLAWEVVASISTNSNKLVSFGRDAEGNPIMNAIHTLRRGSAFLAICALPVICGCEAINELLEADNPAAIREDQLDDETLADVLTNSVVGALAEAYDDPIIWDGSKLTDEHVSGINWPETKDLGRRILPYDAGPADGMFSALSRFRFMADSVSSRLDKLIPNASADRRKALVLALGGYAYTFMVEIMCEATIDVSSKIYTPQELAEIAIEKFQAAIAVAEAAGNSANDVKHLAHVGLARAATAAGNKALVMEAAAKVPADFVWWVEYKDQVLDNQLGGHVRGGNHNMGVHPRVLGAFGTYGERIEPAAQTDPRVQFDPRPRLGHDAQTILYTPFQSLSYSEYTGTLQTDEDNPPITYQDDTDIRLGSYLDAMHNYYEAAGPDGTGPEGSTLDFVNARRAVGNQPPVALSGEALMAELREQRLRDLFLGGFRLGDLRRWKAQGVGDFFPSGTHPNPVMGQYGTAECFPLPLSEFVGNPGLR